MAGLGTYATTAIITDGLTCQYIEPCKRGLMMTPFSLYCYLPPPPFEPVSKPGGGGAYPGSAWNKFDPGQIADFYKPVDMENYYIVPRDQEADYFKRRQIVKMVVKLGERTVEREFSIPKEKAKYVVKALSMVNATVDNMKVAVTSLKRRLHNITVTVSKLRRK